MDAVDGDPEAVRRLGVEVATALCQELLDDGVAGLHLYAMNRSSSIREVYAGLGWWHRGLSDHHRSAIAPTVRSSAMAPGRRLGVLLLVVVALVGPACQDHPEAVQAAPTRATPSAPPSRPASPSSSTTRHDDHRAATASHHDGLLG